MDKTSAGAGQPTISCWSLCYDLLLQVLDETKEGNLEAPELANLVLKFFSDHSNDCIPGGTPKPQRHRFLINPKHTFYNHLYIVFAANCGILQSWEMSNYLQFFPNKFTQ